MDNTNMNNKQLVERFRALFKLVDETHDECKIAHHNEMSLVDLFTKLNGLMTAFNSDCLDYIMANDCKEVWTVAEEIHVAIHCSIGHILESAKRLKTPIIDHMISQLQGERLPN